MPLMIGPGIHLMVDGLTRMAFTASYLESYLRDVVELVGMQVVMGPFVEGRGRVWDGWVVLAESHAAIHVHGDMCHMDLFSCQWFDVEVPLEFMCHRLKLSQTKIAVRERPMPEAINDRQS
jgi:S-adenosylmethionine/arginine decarboxylase-like enzyme